MNLFIAIILDGYFETKFNEEKTLNETTLNQYADAWAMFDPHATGKIPKEKFNDLMLKIKEPLGWDKSYIDNKEK